MISNPHHDPVASTRTTHVAPEEAVSAAREPPRDLRVALLEDILSLREQRIAELQQRIERLEDQLQARERQRAQVIENYERVLHERNSAIEATAEASAARPSTALRKLLPPF